MRLTCFCPDPALISLRKTHQFFVQVSWKASISCDSYIDPYNADPPCDTYNEVVWETRPVWSSRLKENHRSVQLWWQNAPLSGRWTRGVGDAALLDRVTLLRQDLNFCIGKRLGTASEGRISFPAFSAPPTWDTSAGNPKSCNFLLFLSMFFQPRGLVWSKNYSFRRCGGSGWLTIAAPWWIAACGGRTIAPWWTFTLATCVHVETGWTKWWRQPSEVTPLLRRWFCTPYQWAVHQQIVHNRNAVHQQFGHNDEFTWWQQSGSVAAGVGACWDGGLECKTQWGGLGGLGLG